MAMSSSIKSAAGSAKISARCLARTTFLLSLAIGSSFTDSTAGTATLLVDGSQHDAASLQAVIRGLGTAVGPNNIDMSLSTVAAASTLTAA